MSFKNMWKEIKGASRYLVSDEGQIKSLITNKILKPNWASNSCEMVNIYYDDGSHRYRTIHRLVAENFIPNPNNLPQVNHKDENRHNNHIDNLEWCDGKYNTNYGTGKIRQTTLCSKPIAQYTKDGQLLRIYNSAKEAERITGINNRNISGCCNGHKKTSGGYIWKRISVERKLS